jgi:hypothetical protein
MPIRVARHLQNATGMRALRLFFVGLGLASTACVETTTQTRFVSDGERQVLVPPKDNVPSLDVQASYESGVLKGRLAWSKRCRTGVEALSHDEVYEVKKPNRGGGVASIIAGGLVGALSGAILSGADKLSDVETCSTNIDGDSHCSSPRQDATLLGVGGIVTGVGLGVAGLATLGMKTTTRPLEPVDHPAALTKVQEDGVACGSGPVVGVGLALLRSGERVAATSTNTDGDFALVVPARTTGPMAIVVDSVPWGGSMIRQNELLATVDIPATAEADTAAQDSVPTEAPQPKLDAGGRPSSRQKANAGSSEGG